MNNLLFGWMTKPKLTMTPLDEMIRFAEVTVMIVIACAVWSWFNYRRTKKIRQRHGKHCTCWTCMGVGV